MLEIPPRACQINITEVALTKNYIALKSDGSQRILNNYWVLSQSGRYPGAGTVFEYFQGGAHPDCPGQCVFAAGPTTKSVTVQLLYYSKNLGVRYEFVLPNNVPFQRLEGTFAQIDSQPSSSRRVTTRRKAKSPSRFDGERSGQPFSSRTEGSLLIRSRDQLRSSLTSHRNSSSKPHAGPSRRESKSRSTATRRVSPSQPDVIRRRYGYDDLDGRGLSYSQPRRNSRRNPRRRGGRGRKVPVVKQMPRYVAPSIGGRGVTRYEASSLQGHREVSGLQGHRAALASRSYYRGGQKADVRARQKADVRARQTVNARARQKAEARARQKMRTRLNSLTDNDISVSRKGRPVDRGGRGQYEWKISGFTECSVTCGGGFQQTLIICVLKNARTHVTVTEDNCDVRTKPDKQQVKCNSIPCPADWVVSPWSACSVTCGSGTQMRRITCKQRLSRTLHLAVSASKCDDHSKPAVSQMCERDLCAAWNVSAWEQCSVECGVGERKRKVKCVDHHKKHIPNKYCPGPAPTAIEPCNMGACHQQWWVTAWSHQCPADCGSGVQTRSVVCSNNLGDKLDDSLCEQSKKPETQAACRSRKPCDQGTWFIGPWSQCSSGCGTGVRQREVACIKSNGPGLSTLPDVDCVTEDKPPTTEACQNDACGAQWYMTAWSQCSVSCGPGTKQRLVRCLDQLQQPALGCDVEEKPTEQKTCQNTDCQPRSSPQAISTRGLCKDKYRNCRVVVQARLCSYHYYKKICCHSCQSEH
ncbi:thrombospondin type-1 domain-containing protein 4-like isoform X2 [Gigantopelta aegis]|nr:thrombospondin type-1 domain-containing protein 4-like isoform X2 [Gigantopelta aegis]